jgi:hypothetical protein
MIYYKNPIVKMIIKLSYQLYQVKNKIIIFLKMQLINLQLKCQLVNIFNIYYIFLKFKKI